MSFRDGSIDEALRRSRRFRERALGSLAGDPLKFPSTSEIEKPADFIQPDVVSVVLSEETENEQASA